MIAHKTRLAALFLGAAISILSPCLAGNAAPSAGEAPVKKPEWRMWTPQEAYDQYNGATLGLDGRIWIADQTRDTLLVFDQGGKFTTISTSPYFLDRTTRGPDGSIFATTGYASTIIRDSPAGKFTSVTLGQAANGAIAAGPDGSIWIPEESELGRILPDGSVREYPLAQGDAMSGGTSVTQQMGGDVWFDAETPGYSYYLASMNPANGAIKKHFEDLCGEKVLPTIAAPDGRVWAVCNGYFDGFGRDGGVERVAWPPNLGFGMVGAYDNAVIGPDNAIWIAGLDVINNQGVSAAFLRFDLVSHNFQKYDPPNTNYTWDAALAFDPAGNLWAGTENGEVQEVIVRR
jgi:streptogramin lyase